MDFPFTPYKIKKAFLYWKHFGPKEFMNHLMDRMEPEEVPYMSWRQSHRATEEALRAQRKASSDTDPLVSVIVPAYHTQHRFLTQMIDSVQSQSYENWELVIADAGTSDGETESADAGEKKTGKRGRTVAETVQAYALSDPRIKYISLEKNFGIAENTNCAIAAARGEYLAFLDHDDLIEPDALFEMMKAAREKGADMLYSDEDKVTADLSKYYQPHLKPEFNLDLLRSNNYITHFLVVKVSLAKKAGLFDSAMDGAQDYDFIFRCSEKAEKIVRVPRILYHWRTSEGSTSDNPMSKQYAYEAGKRAIEGNLKRTGTEGEVSLLEDYGFYRVRYPVHGSPLVSVIIPNKDEPEALKSCVEAVLDASYKNIEILIVENNSTERATFELYKKLSENKKIHLVRWPKGFNYAAINNYGVKYARGEYLLLLNNDVRATISTGWLSEMLGVCERDDVGAVGAKLYYPDNRVQSAGIVVGIGGVAGSMFVDLPRGRSGYMHKASIMQDMSAVTAACMLVKRTAFEQAGGFTEELSVAFNDVDLCLKIGKCGFRIVYDPYAELYHDESRTRGTENTPEKVRRFQGEIEYMRSHWTDILKNGDPNYNPNLSLKKWNYSLKV